jgi:hypothetical protein
MAEKNVTAAEVLALAKAHGVTILPDGDDLDVVADREPDPELLDAIAGCKAAILAKLRAERGRINHWIADQLIDWPSTSCLHCRKPIVPGHLWTVVSNGEVAARFHQDCHSEWLAQQEVAACRALGLDV